MSNKAKKLQPKLIQIEGQSKLMLLRRAMIAVDQGRAVLVKGMVRFLDDQTYFGYNTAPEIVGWRGRQSGSKAFGGPSVLQAYRG